MSEPSLHQESMTVLQESERLHLSLKELRHRCLNEWQVLAAIVEDELYDHQMGVVRDSFSRILNYIRVVAETHHLLMPTHPSGREQASAPSVLASLCSLLQERYEGTFLRFEIEEVSLSQRQCCSLALICSELVCNAVKHGASRTTVTFRIRNHHGHLAVTDDGPGFPLSFDPKVSANTGLEVVETLCHTDLGGNVEYRNRQCGAEVSLTFPLQ